MASYLALVNLARRECGVSGVDLATLQTGLTAEGRRFATWVADAWVDLQIEKADWEWMRKSFSFGLVPGVSTYDRATYLPDCSDWKHDSFRAYTTAFGATDEQILPYMSWMTYRNVYQFGAMRTTTGRPVAAAIQPNKSLSVGPIPDVAYTVNGEYWRLPTKLVADTDDPAATGNDFPERFHMLLVYDVMQRYAEYESAPEVEQRAVRGYKKLRNRLGTAYLPTPGWGPSLA